MSATKSAPKFKVGDTVVNKHTGAKVVVSQGMKRAGLLDHGHYVHEKERKPMPRSERGRLARDFQ